MSEVANNTEKNESKLMGLWNLCLDAKKAINMQLEHRRSRTASKDVTIDLEKEINKSIGDMEQYTAELARVESLVGTEWNPLLIIEAKRAIKAQELVTKEAELLLKEVEDTIEEYLG
jgi:hypothetical protein